MGDIKMIAMGCKPDPYKFRIVSLEHINGNMVILANYEGCQTFGGDKLMLLKGLHHVSETLDPHFLDDDYPVVARFVPTATGWALARLCAQQLSNEDDVPETRQERTTKVARRVVERLRQAKRETKQTTGVKTCSSCLSD
jgi:hypothetical protein